MQTGYTNFIYRSCPAGNQKSLDAAVSRQPSANRLKTNLVMLPAKSLHPKIPFRVGNSYRLIGTPADAAFSLKK